MWSLAGMFFFSMMWESIILATYRGITVLWGFCHCCFRVPFLHLADASRMVWRCLEHRYDDWAYSIVIAGHFLICALPGNHQPVATVPVSSCAFGGGAQMG